MDENLIPIKAISKGKKQAWTRWKKGRDKKRYAISSTALISTLAINRLIKWREKRARDPSTHPPIIPFVSPTFFSDDRRRDTKIDASAIKPFNWFRLASAHPFFHHREPSGRPPPNRISSNLSRFRSSCMESSIWKGRRYLKYRSIYRWFSPN